MRTPDIFGQTPIMHHLAVFTQKQACMARQFPEAEDLINLVSLPCRAANVVRHHDIMQPYLKPNWSIWPADLPQQQLPQVELTTAFHSPEWFCAASTSSLGFIHRSSEFLLLLSFPTESTDMSPLQSSKLSPVHLSNC